MPDSQLCSGTFIPRHGEGSGNGGQDRIRTYVRLHGQIYSLLPLTTRPPVQLGTQGRRWRQERLNDEGMANCQCLPLEIYRKKGLSADR
jgi:hypothetical protein